jgi:2-methylcitrate dehydratase PrpD
MANETTRLAQYAAALRYEDIPSDVIERAKHAITDTIAVVIAGCELPWSRMVAAYAQRNGSGGNSRILGPGGARVHAPSAALANGTLAHAFEMDNLTWPNTGVHPGATLLSSALAVAQEHGIGGRALITGFVAGSEVMIRIGSATLHHNEERGFHAPGTTGPFGAAVACARLLGFNQAKMTNAIGIAGSLACGLLEFARSGTGAMVKRLHLGRAAESGVLAASLAADGFTGPVSVLEGEYGFLNVYCGKHELLELTKGLGETYATRRILLKRFPCHITAHTAVQAIEDLRARHSYFAADVASIEIGGNQRMATVNNISAPSDIMMAQYSIPFCVALAHVRDPRDPRSYDQGALDDPQVRALMQRITIAVAENRITPLAANVTVTLKDGRKLACTVADFRGTPEQPLSRVELRDKFLLLTHHCDRRAMAAMFDRLQNLENESDVDWIGVDAD